MHQKILLAGTITVQPTTSGMAMTQLSSEESGAARRTRASGSVVSELDEIDLNERLPTDEDLQPVSTAADKSFAAAVTDMMLDEIHEEPSEKVEEIIEEDIDKIDSQAVIEATEEEVRNTMTRPLKQKTSNKSEGGKSKKEVESKKPLERQDSLPEPPKVNDESKEDIKEDIKNIKKDATENIKEEVKDVKENVKDTEETIKKDIKDVQEDVQKEVEYIKENAQKKIKDVKNIKEDAQREVEDVQVHTLSKVNDGLAPLDLSEKTNLSTVSQEVCEIEDETTEERKILKTSEAVSEEKLEEKPQSIHESDDGSMIDYEEVEEKKEEIKENNVVEEVVASKHNVPDEAVDDETTASTDFEMKQSHPNQVSRTPTPPPLPKDPPPSYPVESHSKPTMYGNLSESESSETESESLSVAPKKPNRVSVKQTNVVITKVTAVDAPNIERVPNFEDITRTENQRPKDYVVLTDEEFSEKII